MAPSIVRRLASHWLSVVALIGAGVNGVEARQPPAPAAVAASEATPWGVSSSASGFKNHADWLPKMAQAGVTTVRLFPEWRTFEPNRGVWNWEAADALARSAAEHRIELHAILMGSTPEAKAIHAFPVDDLDDWSRYVANVVGRYRGSIRHWEVWNEGNGGFNDGRHVTADYARLAAATYAAAKQADPQARIGLTVASFDAPYLHQAMLAMAKAGKPGRFDYLCVHPYELADGLANVDGEIPFLWMSRLLRDLTRHAAPERADAEIWITEIGRRLVQGRDRTVTDREAARALVKIYALALAQGVARVEWFEAQDPVGEDQGFGLLRRDGTPRDAYQALKTMTSLAGPKPSYLGWLALGGNGRGYGFVFEGRNAPVLIAWMPAGRTDQETTLSRETRIVDVLGAARTLAARKPLELTDSPVFVVDPPAELVDAARANRNRPFPWGGDFSAARTVRFAPGASGADGDSHDGVHLAGDRRRPIVTFPDRSVGLLVEGDIGHPLSFFVHPSFAGVLTRDYYVRAAVRRIAPGNVGMNLLYEVADSQGRSPYANAGKWFGASPDSGWQTYTWHVKDACFSKMWGYDFALRPEQSVPFAVGKVEVSLEPFR